MNLQLEVTQEIKDFADTQLFIWHPITNVY